MYNYRVLWRLIVFIRNDIAVYFKGYPFCKKKFRGQLVRFDRWVKSVQPPVSGLITLSVNNNKGITSQCISRVNHFVKKKSWATCMFWQMSQISSASSSLSGLALAMFLSDVRIEDRLNMIQSRPGPSWTQSSYITHPTHCVNFSYI